VLEAGGVLGDIVVLGDVVPVGATDTDGWDTGASLDAGGAGVDDGLSVGRSTAGAADEFVAGPDGAVAVRREISWLPGREAAMTAVLANASATTAATAPAAYLARRPIRTSVRTLRTMTGAAAPVQTAHGSSKASAYTWSAAHLGMPATGGRRLARIPSPAEPIRRGRPAPSTIAPTRRNGGHQ
jgi:hypothetical protein